jgi:hypothetical protein
MSSFTVVHADGMTKDSEFREYERLLSRDLLKRGVDLTHVPRVHEPETGNKWLFVWPDEEQAGDFADRLNKQTKTSTWKVKRLSEETPTSLGPLRPIEIQVGWQRNGYTFALAPWAYMAIRALFPESCQTRTVFVASERRVVGPPNVDHLREMATPTLLLLTGLDAKQLQSFDEFVVRDPVDGRLLMPPTPVRPLWETALAVLKLGPENR